MTIRVGRAISSVTGFQCQPCEIGYMKTQLGSGPRLAQDNHNVEVRSPEDHRHRDMRNRGIQIKEGSQPHPCSRPPQDQMINWHQADDQVWKQPPHPIPLCANTGRNSLGCQYWSLVVYLGLSSIHS
jgi:hypothetical protein